MPSPDLPAWVLTRRRAMGDRIRAARLWADLSQEQLAERTLVDRKTINRIELGHHSARIDTLFLIADALDVPLADLVAP
ncbi:helix-turn-helix transcriptional regulator [Streptomyces sp. NPDC058301]|uniref:helix-turn-helix transcriptional regulator n=1 Tax=Streptomyces sp. NPDC058301 TaxID=3346436 RepID=UPI0036E32ADE